MAWQFRCKTESKVWPWNDCLLFFSWLFKQLRCETRNQRNRETSAVRGCLDLQDMVIGGGWAGACQNSKFFAWQKLMIWLSDWSISNDQVASGNQPGCLVRGYCSFCLEILQLEVLKDQKETWNVCNVWKTNSVWLLHFTTNLCLPLRTTLLYIFSQWTTLVLKYIVLQQQVFLKTISVGPPFLPSRYHGQVGFTGFHQQTNEQISICTVYLISTRTTIFAWNVLTFVIMTIRKLQIYLAYAFLQNRVQHKTFHTNNHMFFITLCTSLQMFCFGTPFEFAQHFEATRPAKCATQYEQQSQRAIHENCKPMATRRIFFESNLLKHVHHRRSKTWHVVVVVSRSAHNGMHMQ